MSSVEHARTLNNSVVFGNPLKHHNKIDIIHITWKSSFDSAIFTNIFEGSPLQIDFAILFYLGFQENIGNTCLNNINFAFKTLHHPPDLVCGTLWSFRLSPQVTFARVCEEKKRAVVSTVPSRFRMSLICLTSRTVVEIKKSNGNAYFFVTPVIVMCSGL